MDDKQGRIAMRRKFENTYGKFLKSLFFTVNPLKKKILKTYCTAHKFIIMQAVELLKNEGFSEEYEFYKKQVFNINQGATWADQDFKSSNHFYHFSRGKGLYGFSDALTECKRYYDKSLSLLKDDDVKKAMFYLGASIHLVQDVTVPQHVNNKLLESHRKFELWIISRLLSDYSFYAYEGIVRYDSIESYVKNNALMANSTFVKYRNVNDRNERYSLIASTILKEAQKTTAGMLLDYYEKNREKLKEQCTA